MTTPKDALAESVHVALLRVMDLWNGRFASMFKAQGLTLAQYNVLRILRGGGADGLTCSTIGERLIHRLPDVTRLVDRMEAADFVKRTKDATDRRVVRVALSAKGRALVDRLDAPVLALHGENAREISEAELREMLRILEGVRTRSRAEQA